MVFDENTRTLQLFQLVNGRYEQTVSSQARVWIEGVELYLGLWYGFWSKSTQGWLRWHDPAGNPVLAPEELERQRAERLATKLRELGLDPEQI
ncbi:hypothetical protein [Candidatus Cyanaurora vandensis]|uniref:hypothetical protein n=1 Tax=Candidatus Cyanaurora vandensis TaxID=2714958 RepID=UPI00257BD10C|nr:hypothetical protein [Candidatus Cyanaurora vandensis]